MAEESKTGASPDLPRGDEPITADGIEALRAERDELEGPGRREMAKRIKAARELGDLKENAEYHIAKDDQAHLETRIKRLRERLGKAVVVEADTSASVFAFGRTAEVKDVESGQTNTWTLVGATFSCDIAHAVSRGPAPPVGSTAFVQSGSTPCRRCKPL